MKRLFVLIAAAALAVALYAATAGGQQAAGPTAAQFAALNQKVAKLQKDVKLIKAFLNSCIEIAPVTQYGDATGGTGGYRYKQPSGEEIITTALDITEPGGSPSVVLAAINSSCLQSRHFQRATGTGTASR